MTRKNSAATEPKPAPSRGGSTGYVLVPRLWLATLLALVVLPWLFVGAYTRLGQSLSDKAAVDLPQTDESSSDFLLGKVGPWGQLEYFPIVISPPLEFIPDARGPLQEYRFWLFKNTNPDELFRFLQESGLGSDQVSGLMSTVRPVPQIKGVSVLPSEELVLGLPSATRSVIYTRLAECEFNAAQRNAYRYYGTSVEEWFGTGRLPKEVVALVEPLVYRNGDFMYFSDIDLIYPRLADNAVRRRLAKVLFRESTLMVHLRMPEGADVDQIAGYWGTGGRRLDIRPLLESLGPDQPIDINLLLPVFARRRAYTYRPVSLADFEKSQQVNCFWAAMNFFNDPPDDRMVDYKTVLDTLKRDYYLVHENLQLGDVLMFADEEDIYYHAAVYIADNIVFTKNGDSILSPFVLVPLERLEGYYLGVKKSRMDCYRLKKFS